MLQAEGNLFCADGVISVTRWDESALAFSSRFFPSQPHSQAFCETKGCDQTGVSDPWIKALDLRAVWFCIGVYSQSGLLLWLTELPMREGDGKCKAAGCCGTGTLEIARAATVLLS